MSVKAAPIAEPGNAPRTAESNRGYGKRYIIPVLGQLKVPDVTRADISSAAGMTCGRLPTGYRQAER